MKDDLLTLLTMHLASLKTKVEEEGDPVVLMILNDRRVALEELQRELKTAYESHELCENFRDRMESILVGPVGKTYQRMNPNTCSSWGQASLPSLRLFVIPK
jgi:hypothetical protein